MLSVFQNRSVLLPAAAVSLWFVAGADGAEKKAGFFASKVLPILRERCFECHSHEKKIKGGLALDSKSGWEKGGSSGPAVTPGDVEGSLLVQAVRRVDPDTAMPPKEELPAAEVAILEQWVKQGAPDPRTSAPPPVKDWAEARRHWAFVAPEPQSPPAVTNTAWPRGRVDQFILAGLEKKGLTPSPEAGAQTLLRRVYFDLTGLPPTPQEARAFLADSRPDAYERLVDGLLVRTAFGERMASLWLNLARYAEDQAHQVGGNTSLNFPNAWRYREWVVAAFNADLPYDEFIRKQLAVDLLEPENRTDLAALGFLGLGHKLYSRGRLDVQAEEWAEKVDTVSQTFLGLTVACARCHDHKFDPFPMRDYYAMAGVFASVKMVNLRPDGKPEADNTTAEKMDAATLHVVRDDSPRDLPVYERGDVESPGAVVPRGWLTILSAGEPPAFREGSGRAELARLIADRANPLTSRVFVNRVWDAVFGRPLVRTTSNFGTTGDRPTHPELLDDLAARFSRDGWSVKRLVRELVLSSTYRQDSALIAENARLDEANDSLWRMDRRRLGVEALRDAILSAAGALSTEGGRSLALDHPDHRKRTLYTHISRRELNKTLMLFDYPDANVHASRRGTSTMPTQKLFLMNSPFVIENARKLAARVQGEVSDDTARVGLLFELLFTRAPQPAELAAARDFLRQPAAAGVSAWEQFAHALLATNEMLYVD